MRAPTLARSRPRSSAGRAPASGAGGAGSSPAEGATNWGRKQGWEAGLGGPMTDISDPPRSATPVSGRPRTAVGIDVEDLSTSVKGAGRVLNAVTFSVMPGELVAIVGGSGAGKTTLLEAMAGVRPAQEGRVRFDGVELAGNTMAFRSSLGYVPQDDII